MKGYKEFSYLVESVLQSNDIFLNEPMKKHTSFKVGGPCDLMATPESYDQMIKLIEICKENNIPYYILGNGTNLIVRDGGIRGFVIKTSKLNNIEINGESVIAESGASLSLVSRKSADSGLTGLEFASGIPGSIGGAIAMNAGAYDGEISKIVESVLLIDDNGNTIELSKDEMDFGYRQSIILKKGYTVLRVKFNLHTGDKEKIFNRINELTKRRKEKQPLEYPSAGSTFKRPEGYYASKLIQDSDLKGTSVGDAEVSIKHSGFIINKGNATATDILELIKLVQKTVDEKFGVELQPEVRIIGEN